MLVASDVAAQSCRQMASTVRQIERNRDFRHLNTNKQSAGTLEHDLGIVERAFVQAGCQRALNAGQSLNRQCRNAARQILRGRRDLDNLRQRVQSGNALARQRNQLLEGINGGNCSAASRQPNILEQLFSNLTGGGNRNSEVVIIEEPVQRNYHTLRSVCVRKSDGYYWPVSFATISTYLPNDKLVCKAQCPGADVDLYYYSNPGEDPKDMVNLNGESYMALPNAFQYRTQYNSQNNCKTRADSGKVELVEVNGQSRAMLSIGDLTIPIPLKDPRRETETIVAEAVHVPLPRPRPSQADNAIPVATPVRSANVEQVKINGKIVRIVGPNTLYAQSGVKGT